MRSTRPGRAARLAAAAALLVSATAGARAGGPAPGEVEGATGPGAIEVLDAVSRPSHGAPVGVVYLRIVNHAARADRLVSIASSVSRRSQAHETVRTGDTVAMKPLPEVVIPAGGSVSFEPGGRHIMLIGLEAPLRAGERFELTLGFERAGELRVSVPVAPIDPSP